MIFASSARGSNSRNCCATVGEYLHNKHTCAEVCLALLSLRQAHCIHMTALKSTQQLYMHAGQLAATWLLQVKCLCQPAVQIISSMAQHAHSQQTSLALLDVDASVLSLQIISLMARHAHSQQISQALLDVNASLLSDHQLNGSTCTQPADITSPPGCQRQHPQRPAQAPQWPSSEPPDF